MSRWSVAFDGDCIVTSNGLGTTRKLPTAELRKVVVVTDDSGPWGADVLYFLFTGDTDPAAVFPLEAQGRQNFVEWLGKLPGYDERELARAMGSTSVAEFVVFQAQG